jgi:putative flavoprotein involved in K+ transport
VRLPGVLDAQGQPVHQEGITALPGLYFAGLESPRSRRAGTMLGIAEEAQRIVEHINQRIHGAPTKAPPRRVSDAAVNAAKVRQLIEA